jgi:hypothetical protein
MDFILILVCIPFAISALLVAALPFVAMWEKRPISYLTREQPETPAYLSPYAVDMSEAAEAAGFTHLCYAFDKRGGIYKVVSSIWLSADRKTLLDIACGTIIGSRYRCADLVSRTDGSYLSTTSSGETIFPEFWD